jgi:hypothetical protein
LNIDEYSFHHILFSLLVQGIALAHYATSLNVVMFFFAVKFEPTQQDFLVVDNIYNRVTVGLQCSFLFSFYNYDINILFFLISIAGFF